MFAFINADVILFAWSAAMILTILAELGFFDQR